MARITNEELLTVLHKVIDRINHLDGRIEHLHQDVLVVRDEVLHNRRASAGDTREIKEMIVSLTVNEQQAVNDLSVAVETLATDLVGVSDAAREAQAKIQAFMDQDVVDTADKAALQAIIDAMEADVVGALSPITSRLGDIDANFHNPATPLTAV